MLSAGCPAHARTHLCASRTHAHVHMHARRPIPPQAIGAEPILVNQCKILVRQYLPEVVSIIDKLPPHAVCATIGLCDGRRSDQAARQSGSGVGVAGSAQYRRLLRMVAQGQAALGGGAEGGGAEGSAAKGGGTEGSAAKGGGAWAGPERDTQPGLGDSCGMCEFVVQYVKVRGMQSLGMQYVCLRYLGSHCTVFIAAPPPA